jgi:hypothetical protein
VSERRGEVVSQRDVSLVEVLDRALGAGVVITGDITLSLADVDLVHLDLRLLVASVATIFGEEEPDVLTFGAGG